jgi:hypothetical protein
LALSSLAAVACLALGGVVLAQADSGGQRALGTFLMLGALLGWFFSILPYLAAQALARYIEFRVEVATQRPGAPQGWSRTPR